MPKKRIGFREPKKVALNNYYVPPTRPDIPKFPIPKDLTPVVMNNLKPFAGMTEKSVQFMQILEQIKSNEGLELRESNYLQIFKLMLYVEEIQNNLDMRRYDQEKKRIERIMNCAEYFKVYVDGLMEDRPSVRPGDILEIRDSETKLLFRLNVVNVMDNHIIATGSKRFCEKYSSQKLYNIRFRYQNYPIRCCHYALNLINLYRLTPHFFPIKRSTYTDQNTNLHWYNKNIESNPEQKQAVLNIKSKSCFPYPYILYGPPGTGKTATLVEAICQVWQANPSDNILVCTPSNAAADVITKRLLAYKDYIPENDLYRMYSPSKEGSQIDEEIMGCSNFVDGQVMMLPKELVKNKKIVISTLCACIRLLFLDFKEKHFSYVFIDEAGQAIEPDAMIPFNLLSSVREERIGRLHGQVVIAGDPQQLGPGIRSKYAEPILGRSMLERLMDCEPYKKNEHGQYHPGYITKLLQNYRSHPLIIQVPNEVFYDSELKACGNKNNILKAEEWPHLVEKRFPIIFHGVEGTEVKDDRSPSSYNVEEIKVVRHYVRLLMNDPMKHPVAENEIGIVTPFTAQRVKLHKVLQDDNYNNVDVGTVELFQGQEKDVIILSTVRSQIFEHDGRRHIGFLSNPKRFNVALTRAKALLIVVGNPKILQFDSYWKYFLKFCKDNNACRGVSFNIGDDDSHAQFPRVRRKPKVAGPSDNFDSIEVVSLDDGVEASPQGSVVDENEYPKLPPEKSLDKTFNGRPQPFTAPRTEAKLSDVMIKSEAEIKLEKQAAKKEKRKKKKQHIDEDLTK